MASKDIDLNILVSILIVAVVIFSWLIGGSVIGDVIDKKTEGDNDDPMKNNNSTSTSTTSTSTSTTIKRMITTSTLTTTTTIAPECYLNSDCGENGTKITKNYTCHNGDICRQYIHYRCSKPGTPLAKCIGKERIELIRKCELNEHCIDGEPFCEYLGDIDGSGASKRPSDSTLIGISNRYNNSYKGYLFSVVYVISQESEPRGIAIDIQKPDGSKTKKYCSYGKGVRVDNLVVGLIDVSKWDSGTWANIWIQEMNGF